jgi:hypothetical protein
MAGCASSGSGKAAAAKVDPTSPQALIGNWSTSAYGNVVFKDDGTVTIFDTMTPTYKVDGNKLTLTFGDPLNYTQTGTWEINAKGQLVLSGFTDEVNVLDTAFNPWLM